MGISALLHDLFHEPKHIRLIYFQQSLALVSICRQIVPHVGLYPGRKKQLEEAIESLNEALEKARIAGFQENTEARQALDTATLLIVKYLGAYHFTPGDKVMGDINKLLIGSETALATERVSNTDADVEGKVAVAEKRISELRKKDQDAGQQIQQLSQRFKFKSRLSVRRKKVEVWVWPAELKENLDYSGVHRPQLVFEEDVTLDRVLHRLLDFVPIYKLALSLTMNPQFYTSFLDLRDKPLLSQIEPLQPGARLSECPSVLHLVVDRQSRVVLDVANQVQVFGNVIKVRGDVILKNNLGALVSAHQLLSNEKLLSFYSYPLAVTVKDLEWSSVLIKAAEMVVSCDFLLSQHPPNESILKTLEWKPINRLGSKIKGNPAGKLQND